MNTNNVSYVNFICAMFAKYGAIFCNRSLFLFEGIFYLLLLLKEYFSEFLVDY